MQQISPVYLRSTNNTPPICPRPRSPDSSMEPASHPCCIHAFPACTPYIKTDSADASNTTMRTWRYSDSHFHPTGYVQQGLQLTEMLKQMDELGIHRSTIMPIPTNVLSSSSDPSWPPCAGLHHCGPRYYLPEELKNQSVLDDKQRLQAQNHTEQYVNMGVDAFVAAQFYGLNEKQQSRLDPMITGLHLGDMHSSTYLLQKLIYFKGVFTGVGEITVHKEIVETQFAGKHQPQLADPQKREALLKLLETCGEIGMPVVLHCDIDLQTPLRTETPAHLENIKQLFADPMAKNTTIVWAHAGGLGRFVEAPPNHTEILDKMLEDPVYNHVFLDISWDVVAKRLCLNDQCREQWTSLMNKHSSRFLFGSDALAPPSATHWDATHEIYENFLLGLEKDCSKQIRLGNYERIFVAARAKVRKFEQNQLPLIENSLLAGPAAVSPPVAANDPTANPPVPQEQAAASHN